MIPLPFLWKWLWVNFSPLDDKGSTEAGTESSSSTSPGGGGGGGGVPKNVVVQELLSTKEVNKPDNVQASVFAKALIGRYLCVLFKDSVYCRTRFSDSNNASLYTVRRTTESERESRLQEVPVFPQDLRVKILQELKEERLGRTSARNLLQLMTQPPSSKKPRLETSVSTPHLTTTRSDRLSPSPSSLSPSPSSPGGGSSSSSSGSDDSLRRSREGMDLVEAAAAAAAAEAHNSSQGDHHHHHHASADRKRRREGEDATTASTEKGKHVPDADADEAEGAARHQQKRILPPEPSPRRSSLKRSFSMSSTAVVEAALLGTTTTVAGEPNGRPAQRPRLEVPSDSALSTDCVSSDAAARGSLSTAAGAPTSAGGGQLAAMGRMLRRQVSTPVLPTQIRAGATVLTGVSDRSTVQQEPWKREINDLWAKQLAMMREINTLKNELGRREAARQREILGLRQEIDGLRGEVFRIRQMKGLQPASSENLLATNAQKAPEADSTTSPAAAAPAKAAAVPSEEAAATPQPKVAPGDAPAQASVLLPPPASPTRAKTAAATVSITAP